jgi:hypothetical protein
VEALRLDRTDAIEKLARMAARWAADHEAELGAADPAMPAGIVNRSADNWRPLLAVADLAGSAWAERARGAAMELTADGDDQGSMRVALLADTRAAFASRGLSGSRARDLTDYLAGLEDRPWPEFRAGKAISKTQVDRLLAPLRSSSGTIRLADGRTAKAYYRRVFGDPFARYLAVENVTPPQP